MKPLRVLVLDGNSERREELVALLQSAGHQALAASDGTAAADAMDAAPLDALLLDLSSPQLDRVALRRAMAPVDSEPDSLENVERRHLALALRHTAGNKRKAAHLLGISRSTLLNKVRKYGLAVLLALSGGAPLLAQMPGPIPAGRLKSGELRFDGHATVGDFVGTTTTVSGEMSGGPGITAVRGWVSAPVQTLRTGDGKRDKDLNKSMESSKYPDIRFDLTGVTPLEGRPDSLGVRLQGTLTIHGVTRSVALPGSVLFRESEAWVQSDFPLNLKDYRIGGLSKMLGMLKMSENIEVHVDLIFGLEPGG